MELHPACEPLAFLLGTWSGRGAGDYPTIDAFVYDEEVTYGHVGKPFLSYAQKTQDAETELPLHRETGFLRPTGDDAVELVLVQPSGVVEMHEGRIDGTTLELRTTQVVTTATAKQVESVARRVVVDGEVMTYDLDMAAVGEANQWHLSATLMKQ